MAAKLQEIEGIYQGEKFRRGDFVIGSIELVNGSRDAAIADWLSIKGDAGPDELERRGRYRFYGKFGKYENKRTGRTEKQFTFQTFTPAVAHDREGVIEYLCRAGKGNGLGHATAVKLWAAFGSDAVRTIREDPGQLLAFNKSIRREQANVIASILGAQKRTEDATIDLTTLLNGRGLPKATPRKAIQRWGNKAAMVVRRDPYALMAFRGCGFKMCDNLWLELGHSRTRLRRQALAAWYSVASNSEGHVWFPAEQVVGAVRSTIGAEARPARAIKLAKRLGQMSPNHYGALATIRTDGVNGPFVESGGRLWIAEGKAAAAEEQLAESIVSAVSEPVTLWPDASEIRGIDDHQREKLAEALTTTVAILGGSPGTGKTYATAMLIKHLMRSGVVGPDDIAIACPTGKAAVRITEAMQAAGVNLRAATWHSLLGVSQSDDDGGGWSFRHNAGNPWPFRIIIGDESSMLDVSLMRSVFAARSRGCHFLLVGDVHQLPPVGAGAPLRDMIASRCIGYGELTEIKRNSGGIVEACAAIRDGKPWSAGDNLKVIPCTSPTGQIDAALQAISDASGEFDPVWDCQVIIAVNARSPLSRKIINKRLQAELNSNPEVKGTPFRMDDKIVCLKNGYYSAIEADDEAVADGDDGRVYVANGELARVVGFEGRVMHAELSSPSRVVKIPLGKADTDASDSDNASSGCTWDLAYGMTCHKLQGSEAPVVIVIIDEYPGAKMVCDRSWVYTSFSRAKSLCVVVGKKSTADAMCRRVAIGKRKTMLRELIQLKVNERILEVL